MNRHAWKTVVVLAALAGPATAQVNENNHKIAIQELEEAIKDSPAPAPGVDKAPVAPPAWCNGRPGTYDKTQALDGTRGQLSSLDRYWMSSLLGAAVRLCDADPKDAVVPRAAAFISQHWMNNTGQSAAEAAESIKARLNKDAFEAGKDKLCNELKVSEEVAGAERGHMAAKRDLFDCSGEGIKTVATAPMEQLVKWMDASATPPDEMVRLAYAYFESQATLSQPEFVDKTITYYIADQVDYKALQPDKVRALLDEAPYKGNPYARAVASEALAAVRVTVPQIQAEVQKRAKDDAWNELLVAAPQRGAAAWAAAAGQWKAELQRSNEIEQKAYGPSRKALAGCVATLRKDLTSVLGSYKHETADQLRREINNNFIGGLLLDRYLVCVAVDGDPMVAMGMIRHLKEIRSSRGPRAAGYYAALEALSKIKEDRAKFPLNPEDLSHDHKGDRALFELTHEILATKKYDTIGFTDVQQGVVKTAKKTDKGLAISFNPQKRQIYTEACTTTSRIIMWDHDGRPIYDRNCKPTGLKWVDVSPDPILIADDLAAGIAPGKMLVFAVTPYNSGDRQSMTLEVYADATGKNLVNFFGIPL